MAHSYYINFKIATMFDVSVIITLTLGIFLVSYGHPDLAYYFDPTISLLIALYMLYSGFAMTVGNFKVLIDFPLPEDEQLKIMGVLAQEYESYENIGNIYTRSSGKTRFIEIELYFKRNISLAQITKVERRIAKHLKKEFPEMRFVLIPMQYEKANKIRPVVE